VLSLAVVLVSTIVLTAGSALAQSPADGLEDTFGTTPTANPGAALPDPVTLISKASSASAARRYSGREQITVMADGVAHRQSVSISHSAGTPASGLWPSGAALVASLTTRFLPVFVGRTTLAGRPAYQVELWSKSGLRMATLWVDVKTCLPLGRTLYNTTGQVVRSSKYTTVQVASADALSGQTDVAAGPADVAELAQGTSIGVAGLAGMGAEGWAVPDRLSTGLALFDVRSSGEGPAEVLHLSYTDGLTSLSVFEQRGRLPDHTVPGWTSKSLGGTTVWVWPSAPDQVSWTADGRVFTVVSDDPGRIAGAVSGLPHNSDHRPSGLVNRFRHGVHRILGWVNPF
jgi:hypothetical protein